MFRSSPTSTNRAVAPVLTIVDTVAANVKAVVNEAATEIAQEYISEISPFSGDLDLDGLFLLLPRNVMTADDAEAVTRRYHRRVNGNGGAASEQGPLEFLYGVGLLGVVSTDHVDGRKSQQFLRPGQQSFDTPAVLPRSSHYFIHPILTDLVGKVNQDYIHNVDRTNIIGDGLPWKDGRSEARLCVMKADIRGFSALMEAGDDSEIHMLLHDIVQAHAAECPVADVVEGDSLIIAHENPRTILTVAKRIMQDLNEAPGNPELRVGIDHGVVEMHAGRSLVTTGTPFRVAARLEPHAAPGQILATASFAEALNEQPGMYRALPVNPDDAEHPGQLNIKKPGSEEPDEFIEAYRIVDSV